MPHSATLLLVAALTAAACGTEEPEENPADYYPMAVGRSWTYQQSSPSDEPFVFYRDVTARETIDFGYGAGPQEVYVIENTYEGSDERNIYFTVDNGGRSSRLRTEHYNNPGTVDFQRDYDPGFLRFDRDKLTVGAEWIEAFDLYHTVDGDTQGPLPREYRFEVVATDTEVIVPAGSFQCVVLERTLIADAASLTYTKRYYYSEGVGEVKEETLEAGEVVQTEELVDWNTGND